MKLLIIPDVHQDLTTFNKHFDIDKYDKIIFLGDYCDNWESDKWWLTDEHNPIKVMSRLVDLKKKYPEKIILLLGNHDWSYFALTRENENVSGHQSLHSIDINKFFIENHDYFDIAWIEEGWIFSHAGFSSYFVEYLKDVDDTAETPADIIHVVNKMYHNKPSTIDLDHRGLNPYGDDPVERCLWIRPNALSVWNGFIDSKQVVGHTECKEIQKVIYAEHAGEVYIIDSRGHDNAVVIDTDSNELKPLSETTVNIVNIENKEIDEIKKTHDERMRMFTHFML